MSPCLDRCTSVNNNSCFWGCNRWMRLFIGHTETRGQSKTISERSSRFWLRKGTSLERLEKREGRLVICQVPVGLHKKHSRPESCTCPRLAPVRFVVGSCRTCDRVSRTLQLRLKCEMASAVQYQHPNSVVLSEEYCFGNTLNSNFPHLKYYQQALHEILGA